MAGHADGSFPPEDQKLAGGILVHHLVHDAASLLADMTQDRDLSSPLRRCASAMYEVDDWTRYPLDPASLRVPEPSS